MAIGVGSTAPSTGLLTAQGVGSGLDVQSLVTSLVNAKKDAPQKQITNQQSAAKTQLSALGVVGSSLAALQSTLASIKDGSAFAGRKVSSSDNTVFSASASAGSAPGSYTIDVTKLASAQKVSSSGIVDASRVGTGTLTFTVGNKQMQLDIDEAHASLSSIRDAINNAKDNPGVTATIVNGVDGAHLVMSGSQTGAVSGFAVSSTGDGGLAVLDFDPGAPANGSARLITAAQDAEFTIDGMAAISADNTVANAIDGVSLSLSKIGTSTLNVSNDSSTATGAINNFVASYNSFVSIYKNLTKYDAASGAAGALIGDSTLNSIRDTLAGIVGGVGGDGRTMSAIGVALKADGTLAVDSDKLTASLADGGASVKAMFTGPNGFAAALETRVDSWTGSSGVLANRTVSLTKQLDVLGDRQTVLDRRMADLTARYQKQFTALDTLMSKLNSTSSFLQQQFDALNNSNKN